jgi:hypothetical protein
MMNRRRWVGLALGCLSLGCVRGSQGPPVASPAQPQTRAGRLEARTITFRWQPHPDATVIGYRLHTGRASRQYDFAIDLGRVTTVTCAIAGDGPWFFALTALTAHGESAWSPEARYTR